MISDEALSFQYSDIFSKGQVFAEGVILELVHHDLDNLHVVFPVLYYTEYKYQCETYSSQRSKEVTYIVRRK